MNNKVEYKVGGKFSNNKEFVTWLSEGKPHYYDVMERFDDNPKLYTLEMDGDGYYALEDNLDCIRKAVEEAKTIELVPLLDRYGKVVYVTEDGNSVDFFEKEIKSLQYDQKLCPVLVDGFPRYILNMDDWSIEIKEIIG